MTHVDHTVDVVVPFGDELLVLSREKFEEARQRGRQLFGNCHEPPVTESDEILDAEGMEARTGVPASWWLEQARRNEIPCLRFGKYVRFELSKVLAALRSDPRHAEHLCAGRRKPRAIS